MAAVALRQLGQALHSNGTHSKAKQSQKLAYVTIFLFATILLHVTPGQCCKTCHRDGECLSRFSKFCGTACISCVLQRYEKDLTA